MATGLNMPMALEKAKGLLRRASDNRVKAARTLATSKTQTALLERADRQEDEADRLLEAVKQYLLAQVRA